MKHYVIETKCGIHGSRGEPCGFLPSSVLAMVHYGRDDGTEGYLYCDEFDGFPGYYFSEEDHFDDLLEEREEEFLKTGKLTCIAEFEGLNLRGYEETLSFIAANPNHDGSELLRYLILLTRCEWKELEIIRALGEGKWIEDVVVPLCDIERDWEEERG